MNVLFVYSQDRLYGTNRPLEFAEYIPLGISYISSILRQHGHKTSLIILSSYHKEKSQKLIKKKIREFVPRLICFTAVSTQYNFIASIAGSISERHPDIYMLIGGPHVSLNPEHVIAGPFNALCIGEGEFATLELVSHLEGGYIPKGIANLWVRRKNEVEKNPPRPFLKDLDVLPFPDREIWMDWLQPHDHPRFSILLGRGCPFECTYCCNHKLKRLAEGNYVRNRSPENIINEIQDLTTHYPAIKEIYLEVETIGVNLKWILNLCKKLQDFNAMHSHAIAYGSNLRVTPKSDFEELFTAMSLANFTFINIGLESGSERVRREVLQRNYSNEDILRTSIQARTHGLQVSFFNLIGIPGETIADFYETVRVNQTCCPDWHETSIFYPYPGTKLYSLCEDRGLLSDRFQKNGA